MTAEAGRVRLVLLCGLPGSGKTKIGRQLATESPAIRLAPDEWLTELGIDLRDEPPRDRLEVVFWRLAQDLLRLGVNVILESGFWLRADRDEKRIGGHDLGARVEIYVLVPPHEELLRRVTARWQEKPAGTIPITADDIARWSASFEEPAAEELALFDSATVIR